jgi:hypothetical protein
VSFRDSLYMKQCLPAACLPSKPPFQQHHYHYRQPTATSPASRLPPPCAYRFVIMPRPWKHAVDQLGVWCYYRLPAIGPCACACAWRLGLRLAAPCPNSAWCSHGAVPAVVTSCCVPPPNNTTTNVTGAHSALYFGHSFEPLQFGFNSGLFLFLC